MADEERLKRDSAVAIFISPESRVFSLGELSLIARSYGRTDDEAESFVNKAIERNIFTSQVSDDSVVGFMYYRCIVSSRC